MISHSMVSGNVQSTFFVFSVGVLHTSQQCDKNSQIEQYIAIAAWYKCDHLTKASGVKIEILGCAVHLEPQWNPRHQWDRGFCPLRL